jgi:hypothetical protein
VTSRLALGIVITVLALAGWTVGFALTQTAPQTGLTLSHGSPDAGPVTGAWPTGGGQWNQVDVFEAVTTPAGPGRWGEGALGFSIYHRKFGGTGNRAALDARVDVVGGTHVDDFYVGGGFFATAYPGQTGKYFGANPYAECRPGTLPTADCVGMEINTDVGGPVANKVGLHIVDLGAGAGTNRDDAIRVLAAAGAGYRFGLRIEDTGVRAGPGNAGIRLPHDVDKGMLRWGDGTEHFVTAHPGAGVFISAAAGPTGVVITFSAGGVPVGYVNAHGQYCRVGGKCTAL